MTGDQQVPFLGQSRAEQLLLARRGTAYFAQQLANIDDAELSGPSLLARWTRAHLIAHVAYNATALCRLLDWAATGVETPMYGSPRQRAEEIADGSTLNTGALRNLFDHTVARLDERWRNLPEENWRVEVRTAQGRTVPAQETIWMRVREVWIHAVDLDAHGGFSDFPPVVLESVLADVVSSWRRRDGLVVDVDRSAEAVVFEIGDEQFRVVARDLPAAVRWMVGRGSIDGEVDADRTPPRWL